MPFARKLKKLKPLRRRRLGSQRPTNVLAGGFLDEIPAGYIAGLPRNLDNPQLAHLYKGDFADPGLPMCARGWCSDEGESYSIFRGNAGPKGICKICMRRAKKGLDGVQGKNG